MAAIVEMLAPFRGSGEMDADLLVRSGRPLALAELELVPHATLVDLDQPGVLVNEHLRPSEVATGHRPVTRTWALGLFERHPEVAGIRWWSTLEASWLHVTLFDRASGSLTVDAVEVLTPQDDAVVAAARFLGLG